MISAPAGDAPPTGLLDGASLFLDFDGTLVELEDRPDLVRADAELIELVHAVQARLDGRLAIVTGRSSAHIAELFGDPGFAIGGSHGVEFRWPDGRVAAPEVPATLDEAVAALRAFASSRENVLVETKLFGAGLHYRMAPQHEAAALEIAEQLAADHGLHLQPGKMMIELRAAAGDKGTAIRHLMQTEPFAGTKPIFMGDDVTDEDGFRAVAEMGGAGVLVGAPRDTAAGWHLPDVDAVRAWLAEAVR
ncbi:trehalose-phosphatase [Sphingomonas baiyangensis]|uniref:Trehalose 6-phosphate phosphatase n=1 Tax=Sphingomonas baiyangensis TaxID=2572576 RepID=A0A4U1L1F1_9SPHN|nr:trehalose-phosphatase [Sphingomonas baiyangensis]TKD50304.1 trehalose-phosphatase [Sphingomonas baiyangensis]